MLTDKDQVDVLGAADLTAEVADSVGMALDSVEAVSQVALAEPGSSETPLSSSTPSSSSIPSSSSSPSLAFVLSDSQALHFTLKLLTAIMSPQTVLQLAQTLAAYPLEVATELLEKLGFGSIQKSINGLNVLTAFIAALPEKHAEALTQTTVMQKQIRYLIETKSTARELAVAIAYYAQKTVVLQLSFTLLREPMAALLDDNQAVNIFLQNMSQLNRTPANVSQLNSTPDNVGIFVDAWANFFEITPTAEQVLAWIEKIDSVHAKAILLVLIPRIVMTAAARALLLERLPVTIINDEKIFALLIDTAIVTGDIGTQDFIALLDGCDTKRRKEIINGVSHNAKTQIFSWMLADDKLKQLLSILDWFECIAVHADSLALQERQTYTELFKCLPFGWVADFDGVLRWLHAIEKIWSIEYCLAFLAPYKQLLQQLFELAFDKDQLIKTGGRSISQITSTSSMALPFSSSQDVHRRLQTSGFSTFLGQPVSSSASRHDADDWVNAAIRLLRRVPPANRETWVSLLVSPKPLEDYRQALALWQQESKSLYSSYKRPSQPALLQLCIAATPEFGTDLLPQLLPLLPYQQQLTIIDLILGDECSSLRKVATDKNKLNTKLAAYQDQACYPYLLIRLLGHYESKNKNTQYTRLSFISEGDLLTLLQDSVTTLEQLMWINNYLPKTIKNERCMGPILDTLKVILPPIDPSLLTGLPDYVKMRLLTVGGATAIDNFKRVVAYVEDAQLLDNLFPTYRNQTPIKERTLFDLLSASLNRHDIDELFHYFCEGHQQHDKHMQQRIVAQIKKCVDRDWKESYDYPYEDELEDADKLMLPFHEGSRPHNSEAMQKQAKIQQLNQAAARFFSAPANAKYADMAYIASFVQLFPGNYNANLTVPYNAFVDDAKWDANHWFALWLRPVGVPTPSSSSSNAVSAPEWSVYPESVHFVAKLGREQCANLLNGLNDENLYQLVRLYLTEDAKTPAWKLSQHWLLYSALSLPDAISVSQRAKILHAAKAVITEPLALCRLLDLFPRDLGQRLCAYYASDCENVDVEHLLGKSEPKVPTSGWGYVDPRERETKLWHETQLRATLLAARVPVPTLPVPDAYQLDIATIASTMAPPVGNYRSSQLESQSQDASLCQAILARYELDSTTSIGGISLFTLNHRSSESDGIYQQLQQVLETTYLLQPDHPDRWARQLSMPLALALVEYHQQQLKTALVADKTPEQAIEALTKSRLYHYLGQLAVYFKAAIAALPENEVFEQANELARKAAAAAIAQEHDEDSSRVDSSIACAGLSIPSSDPSTSGVDSSIMADLISALPVPSGSPPGQSLLYVPHTSPANTAPSHVPSLERDPLDASTLPELSC